MSTHLTQTEKDWQIARLERDAFLAEENQRREQHAAKVTAIYAVGGYISAAVVNPASTSYPAVTVSIVGRRLTLTEAIWLLPSDALEAK